MNKEELKQKIIDANKSYRFGDAAISDVEFDALVEQYQKLVPEDEFNEFRNSLNEGTSSGSKVKHKFIMGSLDKIKNTDAVSLDKFLKEHISTKLNISAKVDGISSVAKYVNGKLVSLASRGDGYEGTDFTDKAAFIKGLPAKIKHEDTIYIRGELVIYSNEDLGTDTNYRNVCAGIMNRKEWTKEDVSHISFVPYTILGDEYTKDEQFKLLEDLGFNAAWHRNIAVGTDVFEAKDLLDELTNDAKLKHLYDCDGLVLTDANAKNEIDSYRPKNAKAFKINELTARTKFIAIDWNGPSKDGTFVPVGILEPVKLGGSTISRVSCHNLDVLEKEYNVDFGDEVEILKSGDIIPKIINVCKSETLKDTMQPNADIETLIGVASIDIDPEVKLLAERWEAPTHCPCCGSKLVRDGINLRCINKNCKDQVIFKIMHFIKKLGVKNCSFATLDNLGIHSFEALVKFTPNKKYKTEVKLYEELNSKVFTKSKQELLAAMNFCGVGETIVNKIVDFYGYENVEKQNFIGYPSGVGESFLSKFKEDIIENLGYVNMFIHKSRYNFSKIAQDSVKSCQINKNGQSVCFTGKLFTMTRGEASKKAEAAGFEVKGGVNKGLTYLVTNNIESGSSKARKAKELGTKVINEQEFLKLVSNFSQDLAEL